MTTDPLRALPHSAESEQAALCCLLWQPATIPHAIGILSGADFHVPAYRLIFDLLTEFSRDSRPIDTMSIQQALIDRSQLEEVGGPGALLEIFNAGAVLDHFDYYAALLLEKTSLRQLWIAGEWIQKAALAHAKQGGSVDQLLTEAGARVEAGRRTIGKESSVSLREAILALVNQLDDVSAARSEGLEATLIPTITTGLPWVDAARKGYERGSLALHAALSHAGKTALVRYAMVNQARAGLKCLHFSLESTVQREAAQALATLAPIRLGSLKDAYFEGTDAERIIRVGEIVELENMRIDESAGLTIEAIVARARAHHAKHGLDVVAIDHGLIVNPSDRRASREEQCAHISGMAKQLAKQINGVVVLLWQFNKTGQTRGFQGKCPGKADLMWTSAVFQDADYALFMHCPDVRADDSFGSKREIYLPKWRNGGTLAAPITLQFDGETQSFAQI